MLKVPDSMLQEAKPSWLKLAALECLHEYTTSDELPTRLKKMHIVSSELNQSSDAENVIDMEMDAFAAIVSNYLDPPHPKGLQSDFALGSVCCRCCVAIWMLLIWLLVWQDSCHEKTS